jgi:trans-aconitate methyltransferase
MDPELYLRYHGKRFEYIVDLAMRSKPSPECVVMDVGPGPLSGLLRQHYRQVWTLGMDEGALFDATERHREHHITFDLNHASDQRSWVQLPTADLIVFSEVIEHLFCDPVAVLRFLASGLRRGGLIICTTPNIAAFHKRIRAVLGKTPWHRWESGHVTEFERDDLLHIARHAGLKPVWHEYANYFGVTGSPLRQVLGRALDATTGVVPTLRRGQAVSFLKEA